MTKSGFSRRVGMVFLAVVTVLAAWPIGSWITYAAGEKRTDQWMEVFPGLIFLITFPLAGLSFAWFVGSLIWASRKKKTHVSALPLLLWGASTVLAGLVYGSARGWITPPYLPHHQINVAYSVPKISPDGKTTYFSKTVTQERVKPFYHQVSGMQGGGGHWELFPARTWAKTFICRSRSDGISPEILFEVFSEKYSPPFKRYRFANEESWPTIKGFDVSWRKKDAIVVSDKETDNLQIVDLQTPSNTGGLTRRTPHQFGEVTGSFSPWPSVRPLLQRPDVVCVKFALKRPAYCKRKAGRCVSMRLALRQAGLLPNRQVLTPRTRISNPVSDFELTKPCHWCL